MKKIFAIFCLMLTSAASDALSKDQYMHHAAGEFEVKMNPVSAANEPVMRMSNDRQSGKQNRQFCPRASRDDD